MRKSTFEEIYSDKSRRRLLEQERFILEATECLARVMEKENISKVELSEKLGKSKAFVTQVLAGGRNMTIRTFADFMFTLGYTAKISEEALYESNKTNSNEIFVGLGKMDYETGFKKMNQSTYEINEYEEKVA